MSRDLRLLAGAVFLSAAGDLLALIVLALQVHELTGSGLAVSALFATTLVPMVALAPLAGLVADRFESVLVLVAASLAQALAAVALAFSSDMAAILALSSLLTAGNAFSQPAEFALVPAVAGSRPVTKATGVLEAARYAGFAAGPALAAGLAALGPRPALLVNAASFVAIAAAAGAMRARRPPCAATGHEHQRALDGFRLLRRDRVLRVTIAAAVGALLFISASLTVEIFYLKDVVGASDSAYALLVCAWMAGMVCGATALARRVPAGLVATAALVALAVQGAGMGIQTAWAILPVAFAGYLVGGLGHGVKNVLLRALLTVRVPEAVHGRAFAAYNAARNSAELGAVGAGGVLVSALGPRAALMVAGVGPILAALAGLTALRRRGRAALRHEAEEVLQSGRGSGYAKTRFLAQMEWALVDLPGIEDMVEFETRVNYIVPKYDHPVICAYDLSKFGASTVMYALRTHPVVIIGGLLQENPFYTDPDELLVELQGQHSHVRTGIA